MTTDDWLKVGMTVVAGLVFVAWPFGLAIHQALRRR